MNVLRLFACLLFLLPSLRAVADAAVPAARLQMVVVVSRHGVRSPTHPNALQAYAREPWPAWSVPPGNLTAHGALLMRQAGTYYRGYYGPQLGMKPGACPEPGSVFVWADVDQRTRATGAAIVAGVAPGCDVAVRHAADSPDPLFDPLRGSGGVDGETSRAAILGAVGSDFGGLDAAYEPAFATLERVLGCAAPAACKRIATVPTTVASHGDGRLATISGGLAMAADVAENLLLEYVDGHPDVGWGRVDRAALLQLLQFQVLGKKLEHGNYYTARAHSSNVATHVLQTLDEGVTGEAVAGTQVPPQSRFVFLAAHDTQLAEIAGLLGLSWLIPGDQFDDTPPGSALVFELYAPGPAGAAPFVRTFFVAQSLDAMRAGRGSTLLRAPVYVPGCPSLDCPFATFSKVVNEAVDPAFVKPW